MIIDLDKSSKDRTEHCDVCIIGTGPAGLALLKELAAASVKVILLDTGPETAFVDQKLDHVVFKRNPYEGISKGRAFGLGGTSSLWGGQLLPIRAEEMAARSVGEAIGWAIPHSALAPYYQKLTQWLRLGNNSFNLEEISPNKSPLADLRRGKLHIRLSKWLPFTKRNFARSWSKGLLRSQQVKCFVSAEAYACSSRSTPQGLAINSLEARSPSGKRLVIHADFFAICAGALATPILLQRLLSSSSSSELPSTQIGFFLHDHLSIRLAKVTAHNRSAFNRLFGPQFEGTMMRTAKFELPVDEALKNALPPSYLHFAIDSTSDNSFSALRDLFRGLQAGDYGKSVSSSYKLLKDIPNLLMFLYWRFVLRRLRFPPGATINLQLDFEQPAFRNNFISLDSNQEQVIIDWAPQFAPWRLISEMKARIEDFWKENGLAEMATLDFVSEQEIKSNWPNNLYDIFHPAGTTRMAESKKDGVVDTNLKVFGTSNCFVVSSSVFPSIGVGNPTFTIMALALRLGHYLVDQMRAQTTQNTSTTRKED